MRFNPYPYQQHAVDHIIRHKGCGLFLEMGLGKTVSTLTAIDLLMHDYCEVSRVLVIAPKRVAEHTWTTEAQKWDHLQHLRISVVLGNQRQRINALKEKADIYVINRENVVWLLSYYGGACPFDMLVVDELSSFKDANSARFKALRVIRPKFDRVVGLTGTPAPNSLLDLWSQLYLLDRGQRLGETKTAFRSKYFYCVNNGTYSKYVINSDEAKREIFNRIADICISMKEKDYLSLPKRIDRRIDVWLSEEHKQQYEYFERDQVLLLNDDEISAVNAAALTGKLLQFANGAIYREDKSWVEVHDEKLQALEEVIEAANGNPVLVFYWFKHDLERIMKHLKGYKPRMLKGAADIDAWNRGEIPVMLVHPASAGHGLNLQAGGNVIVWFGLTWSLELYQQANARLHRQGQTRSVIVHHLIARGTVDEDVMKALSDKADTQEALMQAVKARIEKYQKQVA